MKKKRLHDKWNRFSLGAQVGGPDAALATGRDEQRLRDAMNRWTGNYSTEIKHFAFLLRVDGEFHEYTQEWKINGAQKAKRKGDSIEVEIGIPKNAWRVDAGKNYRRYLALEVEKGLHSMIALLHTTREEVDADALLSDWEKIKREYFRDDFTQSSMVQ